MIHVFNIIQIDFFLETVVAYTYLEHELYHKGRKEKRNYELDLPMFAFILVCKYQFPFLKMCVVVGLFV